MIKFWVRDQIVKEEDLKVTEKQMELMRLLLFNPFLRVKDLARALKSSPDSIGRQLRELVAHGLARQAVFIGTAHVGYIHQSRLEIQLGVLDSQHGRDFTNGPVIRSIALLLGTHKDEVLVGSIKITTGTRYDACVSLRAKHREHIELIISELRSLPGVKQVVEVRYLETYPV